MERAIEKTTKKTTEQTNESRGEPDVKSGEGRLDGQVALVTGAGRGIGRVIAQALAEAGAAVALVARSSGQLEETLSLVEAQGGRAIAFPADVTDEEAVRRLVRQTTDALGPIDLLVANAGIGSSGKPFWEDDLADWWRLIEVNVKGVMLCAQAVLPGMIARRRGRIINTGSYAGVKANPGGLAYSVSKTAVLRFSEALANEVRPYGIQVFAISPGLVHTAMTERQWRSLPPAQQVVGTGATTNPTGDWSPPELAAQLVVRLAAGEGDALSGRFIHARADDLAEMCRRAAEIEREDLYTLRLRKLT